MNAVDVVNASFKAIEDRDWDAIDRLISDDLQFVGPMPQPLGKQEFIGLHRAILVAFPDWRFHQSNLQASDDRVSGNVQVGGTHQGTLSLPGLPEIPATGKYVQNPVEPISFEVVNAKITRVDVPLTPGGGVPGLIEKLGVAMPK